MYICSPLDDNDDDLDLSNESNNSEIQQTPTRSNGQPPHSGSPSKKRKVESEVERYYKFKSCCCVQHLK